MNVDSPTSPEKSFGILEKDSHASAPRDDAAAAEPPSLGTEVSQAPLPPPVSRGAPGDASGDGPGGDFSNNSNGAFGGGPGGRAEASRLFFWFFLILLGFALYLLYMLMSPFLHSIILACVFTAISYPLYMRILAWTKGRRVPAAIIMMVLITLLIAALATIFVSGLVPQAKTSIDAVNKWLGGQDLGNALSTHIEPLLQWLQEHFPELELSIRDIRDNLTQLSTKAGQYVLASATAVLGNTLAFFTYLLLTLLMMFFLFIDGAHLVARLAYLFPMKPEQTAVVIESLRKMSRAVLVGGFSVALLQGLVGGIGLFIVGIPALFWGTVMVFAALVPVVGTGLVWIPAVLFLLLKGDWKSAIFLSLWCGLLVAAIDSVLRPILLRGGAKVPLLFLFMSIVGGINVFGMLGLLYGPLILGFVAVMLDIYAEEYNDILESRSGQKPSCGQD